MLKPAALLQVHNDEPGLRNCWFSGVVRQTAQNHALVSYDELDDEDESQLQEWFPLPGAAQPSDHSIAGAFTVHTLPMFKMRPRPPEHVRTLGRMVYAN
jgi:hypothetical protein